MIKAEKQAITDQAFRDIKANEEAAQARKTERLKAARLQRDERDSLKPPMHPKVCE